MQSDIGKVQDKQTEVNSRVLEILEITSDSKNRIKSLVRLPAPSRIPRVGEWFSLNEDAELQIQFRTDLSLSEAREQIVFETLQVLHLLPCHTVQITLYAKRIGTLSFCEDSLLFPIDLDQEF